WTSQDLLYDAAPEKDRFLGLRLLEIMRKPVACAPGVARSNDLRVPQPVRRIASIQQQVTDDAPCRRDLEFHKEIQQPIDHDPSLDLTASTERFRAEQIQRAPDELQIQTEGEDTFMQLRGLSH